jgi:hypothetical protein
MRAKGQCTRFVLRSQSVLFYAQAHKGGRLQPKMAEQLNIWDRIKRELALQVAYLPLQPVVNYLLAAAVATMIWLFTTYQDWWWPWAALISVAVLF